MSGVFGIFSHTLTQLIAGAQETDDDDNTSHHTSDNNTTKKKKQKGKKQPQSQNKTEINITD